MGLLDQVLGQVIGQMGASSGAGGRGPAAPGGLPGGLGGGLGGGFGGGLGGGQLGQLINGPGGKIALAVLALLASKHLKSGAGGYGSVLHDMLAGGASSSGEAVDGGRSSAPTTGGGDGFLNEIGGMLGSGSPAPSSAGGAVGGSPGGLGGLLGGALGGGALAGGLGELLQRFQQNGGGDTMNSWIGSGTNHSVDPDQLEQHLGADTVEDLSRQTGLDRGDLLGQLSQALPQIVDKLTPHGRLPTEDEGSRWI